ncbi:WSSV373 [White spot syndrome virus]|uniref:WSSV373 n=1 Tax=White spot syndrome virus TaxID=342409 RepID=A0A2I6SC67_9VIRU|nr:WSSV373 [White spot syndrome virus]
MATPSTGMNCPEEPFSVFTRYFSLFIESCQKFIIVVCACRYLVFKIVQYFWNPLPVLAFYLLDSGSLFSSGIYCNIVYSSAADIKLVLSVHILSSSVLPQNSLCIMGINCWYTIVLSSRPHMFIYTITKRFMVLHYKEHQRIFHRRCLELVHRAPRYYCSRLLSYWRPLKLHLDVIINYCHCTLYCQEKCICRIR